MDQNTTSTVQPVEPIVCIRRRNSTWTRCTCPSCARRQARLKKMNGLGMMPPRATSAEAWAAFDEMLASHWTLNAIASACRLPIHTVDDVFAELKRGHRRTFGAGIAKQIVNHGQPKVGSIGATVARRKVQALARSGYPVHAIAEAADLGSATISRLQNGKTERIKAFAAARIDRAWRKLAVAKGPNDDTGKRAAAAGWEGVGAWANIDNPHEQPEQEPSRRAARILRLREEGKGIDAIATAVGCTPCTVRRVIRERATSEEVAA